MTFTPHRSLVTGASSGIGAQFARRLAARGSDLVLVARRTDRLERLAADLTDAHRVRVDVIGFDLSEVDAGMKLRAQIGVPIDFVVNNAGFGAYGPLADADIGVLRKMIDVDIRAVVELTHAFLPDLQRRRGGGILNVASTASYQPLPGMATYAAAKAFVRSFTEAIWHEAKPYGVKVTALSPGTTESEFFTLVGDDSAAIGGVQTADQVVDAGMKAMDRRSTPPSVISGRSNALRTLAARVAPQRLLVSTTGRMVGAAR